MKKPLEVAAAAMLSVPNSTSGGLGILVGIQKYLERNTLLSQAQLRFWINELIHLSEETIQSPDQKLLFFQLLRSFSQAAALCSAEAFPTIPIARHDSKTAHSGITPNLDASYLWHTVFRYFSFRTRAGTATISKKWRNLLETCPLRGILPLMRIGNHRMGWIFFNTGVHKRTLREWRPRLREMTTEDKENFQHMQIIAAAVPLNDLAKFELKASDHLLREMENISFLNKIKIYMLGFFTCLIGMSVTPKTLMDHHPLLSPIVSMMAILMIVWFFLKRDGNEIGQKNQRVREYYSIMEDRHRLLKTKPAQDLRDRLYSFTTVHHIADGLTEMKQSQPVWKKP
jgi:hypothetical protein